MVTDNFTFLMFVSLIYGAIIMMITSLLDLFPVSPRQSITGIVLNLLLSFIAAVFVTILDTGFSFISLNIVRSGRAKLRDLFLGFRYHPGRLFGLSLLLGFIRYICLVPVICFTGEFVIHGTKISVFGHTISSSVEFILLAVLSILLSLGLYIAVCLLFSQALFLFIDQQDMGIIKCMSESKKLMSGNRIRLFRLYISFIGYWALVVVSFGLALICVKPYFDVTKAFFYVKLTGKSDPYGV